MWQSQPDAEGDVTCLVFPPWSSSETGVGDSGHQELGGRDVFMRNVSAGDNEEGSGNVGDGLYTTQTYLMVHTESG